MKKDEARPLIWVGALCFLHCFNTAGWVTEIACKKAVPLIFKDCSRTGEERNQGGSG